MKISKPPSLPIIQTFRYVRPGILSMMGLVVVWGWVTTSAASTPKPKTTHIPALRPLSPNATPPTPPTNDTEWQRWYRGLKSPHFWQRRRSLQQLSRLVGYPSRIRSTLLQSLHDPDPRVQISAIVLLQQHHTSDLLLPVLVQKYAQGTHSVKRTILTVLGQIIDKPSTRHTSIIMPVLLQGLQESHTGVQKQAIIVLGRLGSLAKDALPALIKMAQQTHSPDFVEILRSLGRIGSQIPAATPHLLPIFQQTMVSTQPQIREVSIRSIGHFGTQAKHLGLVLRQRLNDQDPDVRKATLWALAQIQVPIHGQDPALVTEVFQRLDDPDPSVRIQAQTTLTQLGSPAVAMLKKALRHKHTEIRTAAAWTLGRMGQHAHSAGIALAQRLQDPEVEVRIAAVQALCRIQFTKAIWPLIRKLRDEDWRVREATAAHLKYLEKTAHKAIPALAQLIYKDEYHEVRAASIRTLAHLGVARWTVTALWRKGLRDDDAEVRELSATTLGRFGKQARVAVHSLGRSLRDHDHRVRKAAIVALRQIGSARSVRYLAGLLRSKEAEFQGEILATLRSFGHKAKSSIPTVLQLLRSRLPETRIQTIRTLAQLGRYKGKVIHALQKALEDSNPDVRKAAHQAIKHLQGLAQASSPHETKQ